MYSHTYTLTHTHTHTYHTCTLTSLTSHTLHRKRVGHTATIELSPFQKLAVTNEIRTLRRLHPLSRSSNCFTTALFDNCLPWRQLIRCSVTTPFLSLQSVWLPRLHPHIYTLTSTPPHLHTCTQGVGDSFLQESRRQLR